jgi:hypothetical protein
MRTSFFFLQPVHNIFLLFLAETGVIIGSISIIELTKLILLHKNNIVFLACIFVIIITGMFDHYWLTLQQNMLVMGTVLGMSLNEKKSINV